MPKVYILMFFAVILAAAGNVLLSVGMKQIGAIEITSVGQAFQFGFKIIKNHWILLGTVALFGFFILYLISLSIAELSLVTALSAASYIFIVLFSKYFLHEEVSLYRIGGMILVAIGVALVSSH